MKFEQYITEKQAKTDALDYAADAGLNTPALKKAMRKFKVKMKVVAQDGVNGWPEVVFSGEEKNLIAFLRDKDGYGLDYDGSNSTDKEIKDTYLA